MFVGGTFFCVLETKLCKIPALEIMYLFAVGKTATFQAWLSPTFEQGLS